MRRLCRPRRRYREEEEEKKGEETRDEGMMIHAGDTRYDQELLPSAVVLPMGYIAGWRKGRRITTRLGMMRFST